MTRYVLLFLLVLSAAAQAQSRPTTIATPDELAPRLRAAEIDGARIFRHDRAASVATDALRELKGFRRDKRVVGWITEDRDGSVVVTFHGAGSAPEALYRVAVSDAGTVAGAPEVLDPVVPLTEQQAAQASARALALGSDFPACSKTYNTVVLPRAGDAGNTWSVYLLPGTTKRGVLPAGGNHRVDTDAAGKTVLSSRGFTKSCIELEDDDRAVSLMLTHLMDPAPTEIHVFLTLLAGKPMYLLTIENAYMWAIENGKIRFSQKIDGK